MANGSTGDPTAPALAELAESITAALLEPGNLDKLRKHAQSVALEQAKDGAEFVSKITPDIVQWLVTKIIDYTSLPGPIGDALGRAAMNTLLKPGGARAQDGLRIGNELISRLAGTGAALQPSYDGAAGLVGLVLSESIEAWVRGVVVEAFSGVSLAGFSAGDGVETFAQLQDVVEGMLGGGRLVRQVLGPIIHATAVTPATWQTNLRYRPELLGAGAAVEAFLSHQYSSTQLLEELARQGYSDERVNVLVNNARKRLSFADLVDQHFRGALSDADVYTRAGELGYDQATAAELLALATARHRDKWKDPIADTAVAQYLAGELEELDMRAAVESAAPNYTDAQGIIAAAKARRELRRHGLSSSDERRLVVKGIRSVGDYRRALASEGYNVEAQIALELELRFDLDARADLEAAKAAAAAARAEEERQREAERLAREAELAARKALPTLNEYRRAYVRGHIDRSVLAAAITREKIAITPRDLELLLADADEARAAYLAQLEAKRIAEAKRPDPALSASTLEAAVLADILTLGEYDVRLAQLGYDDDERRVLVSLLGARLEDRDEARRRRAEATAAAEVKQISLPDLERAVRLGLRTRGDYAAVLDSLGTTPIAKALLLDLLNAEIAQDAAARKAREAREAAALLGELSLPQRRRAVLAGVLARAAYEAALVAAGWPPADRAIELAMLDREVAEAAAPPTGELSLPQRRRAVLAGVVPRSDYEAALVAAGWPPADRAIELGLVDRELAAARAPAAGALSMSQRRRAVLAGVLPRRDYEAALIAAGWSVNDQLLELALVDLEMAQAAADRARREQIAAETEERRRQAAIEKAARAAAAAAREAARQAERAQRAIDAAEREAARELERQAREAERLAREAEREARENLPPELTLGQMERAVKLGILPPDALRAWLEARRYGAEDIAIVVALAVEAIPDVIAAQAVDAQVTQELAAQGVAHGDLKNAVRRGIRTLEEYGADLAGRGYGADAVALLEQLLGEQVAIDVDGLRASIKKTIGKAADAPPLEELEAALGREELDAAQLRDVLALYGVPRDTALVFARLVLAGLAPAPA